MYILNHWVECHKMPDLTLTFLSWTAGPALFDRAMRHWKEARAQEYDWEDTENKFHYLCDGGKDFKEDTSNHKGKKKYLDKIYERFMEPIQNRYKPHRDLTHMKKFLEVSQETGFPEEIFSGETWLPGGAPAIAYATLNRRLSMPYNSGGWQFPDLNRLSDISDHAGISKRSRVGLEIVEVTLDENVGKLYNMLNFVDAHMATDNRMMPGAGSVMSFDTEDMAVPISAFEWIHNWKSLPDAEKKKPKDFTMPNVVMKTKNLTTRIIIGNGLTWMVSIRFPWGPETVEGYLSKRIVFRPVAKNVKEVLEQLWKDRMVVGAGIIADIKSLSEMLRKVYGLNVQMPVPVEMSALALAAGYRFPRVNLFFLQLILTGGVHNKLVSCSDNSWGYPWDELDKEFRLYLLADVRHGYECFTVLITLIINHMFPDPVQICEFLSLNQERAFEYLVRLTCATLANKEFNHQNYVAAQTRKELVTSLRASGQHSLGPPQELVWFSYLIPPWPTLPYGGARDFHTVAIFFAESQANNLVQLRKVLPKPRSDAIKIYTRTEKITPEEKAYLTFDREPVVYEQYPGASSETTTPLLCRSDLKDKVYSVTKLTHNSLMACKRKTGQPIVIGLLEWLRCQPVVKAAKILEDIGELGEDLGKPEYKETWIKKVNLYQKIKSQIYCRTNVLSETNQFLERIIAGKKECVFNQEDVKEQKLMELVEYNNLRKEKMIADTTNQCKLPTSKIHVQGKHYALHPKAPLHQTIRRKQRRQRALDKAIQKAKAFGTIPARGRGKSIATSRGRGKLISWPQQRQAFQQTAHEMEQTYPQRDYQRSPTTESHVNRSWDEHMTDYATSSAPHWDDQSERVLPSHTTSYQEDYSLADRARESPRPSTSSWNDNGWQDTYMSSPNLGTHNWSDYDKTSQRPSPIPGIQEDHYYERYATEGLYEDPTVGRFSTTEGLTEDPAAGRYTRSCEGLYGDPPQGDYDCFETEYHDHLDYPDFRVRIEPNHADAPLRPRQVEYDNYTPRPEAFLDPPTPPSGYSDVSSVEFDFTPLGLGKGKGKGKGKKWN